VSGLGKRGPGGWLIGSLQGNLGDERVFVADMFQEPEAGWPITVAAPLTTDTYSATGFARAFDDDVERGIGLSFQVPVAVTSLLVRIPARAAGAPASPEDAVLRIYARVGAGAWSGAQALGIYNLPNDLTQSHTFSTLLAPLGVSAGDYAQFLITRNPASGSDTLVGFWHLYEVGVNFV
jgi:hypothetical protein